MSANVKSHEKKWGNLILNFKNEIKDVSNSKKKTKELDLFFLSRKFHTKIPLFDDIIHRMFRNKDIFQ